MKNFIFKIVLSNFAHRIDMGNGAYGIFSSAHAQSCVKLKEGEQKFLFLGAFGESSKLLEIKSNFLSIDF